MPREICGEKEQNEHNPFSSRYDMIAIEADDEKDHCQLKKMKGRIYYRISIIFYFYFYCLSSSSSLNVTLLLENLLHQ